MTAAAAPVPLAERPWPGLDIRGTSVLVIGFGRSGYAVADQCMQRGARVSVIDAADTEAHREQARILEVLGVDVRLGAEHMDELPRPAARDGEEAPEAFELVVPTPGMRPDHPLIRAAEQSGACVWGEVELARRLQAPDGPVWLGVTGTNGKTTVVTMLESILLAAGCKAVACGNVGLPLIEAALDPAGHEVLAVELSSFQLHRTEHADCEAAVVLGVGEDHLDWHGSLDAYAADKGRIYTGGRIACIYPVGDARVQGLVEDAEVVEGCRAIGLTLGAPGLSELGVVEDLLVDRAFIAERRTQAAALASLADLAHLGPHGAPAHMVYDALAAAALARAHGVDADAVREGLRAFRPGRHRAEIVAEHDGAVYVDDSKATNPEAAAASLGAAEHAVWIAGGLTKGADLAPLVAQSASRLRGAVLIGADASPFEQALAQHAPDVPVRRIAPEGNAHEIMDRAVRAAAALADAGDVVLLAPAAASMDQFADYAERGDLFVEAARGLGGATESPAGSGPGESR